MNEYTLWRHDKSINNEIKKWDFEDTTCNFGKNIYVDSELMKKKLLFAIASKGRYMICYVKNTKNEIVHYSFMVPHCRKFSFMNDGDIQIGPCWTKETYRGKGIYGKVLNYIAQTILRGNKEANLYVLIREANVSSIKGIRKADFVPVGKCKKTAFLKHYQVVEWF